MRYLVEQAEGAENVKIRVLSVSWKELARDAERAVEFDQSQLFRKVYSEEFDTPGGEPFGVLLGDYEIRHRLTEEHPVDDVATLKAISGVAAAAFAPFIASAHPSLFGLDEFATLEQPLNLPRAFDQLEYLKWQEFRELGGLAVRGARVAARAHAAALRGRRRARGRLPFPRGRGRTGPRRSTSGETRPMRSAPC